MAVFKSYLPCNGVRGPALGQGKSRPVTPPPPDTGLGCLAALTTEGGQSNCVGAELRVSEARHCSSCLLHE